MVDLKEASVLVVARLLMLAFHLVCCPHHAGLLFTGRAGDFKSFIHRFSSVK
jgi:hypothetical protein